MKVPERKVLDSIIMDSIYQTSNKTLQFVICACCARETDSADASVFAIAAIPNHHLLKPQEHHEKHDLFNGILLEPAGIKLTTKEATICVECHDCLLHGKLPALALANNMWLDPIPAELSDLMLAEHLLISRYFPMAYIFKLYSKPAESANWDSTQLYNRMKGNMSTYLLDIRKMGY